jgi:DNA-binding transcriptional ArsR family regulator
MKWIVPDLLPEGLAIIAGKPKTGKSWLALNLAAAVSIGGSVLGRIKVERGDVLYLALEDGERRLRTRIDAIKALPTDRLTFWTACPRGEKGLEDLRIWLQCKPDARLLIVDTLARIREDEGEVSYQRDYDFIARLKSVADGRKVALVLVHHSRKQDAEDALDLVSGTTGITGAADSLWILQRTRGQVDATLTVSGRDFAETELALRYDPGVGWSSRGDAREIQKTEERQAIRDHLAENEGPLRTSQIAKALGKTESVVSHLLSKMRVDGIVTSPEYGKWSLTVQSVQSVQSGEVEDCTTL